MPLRPCLGCDTPTGRPDSRCPACASARNRAKDAARGNRHARGYGSDHDVAREAWRPRVERGDVRCARCELPIRAGQQWALDHTDDRSSYLGPSHKRCNESAAGKAAHR